MDYCSRSPAVEKKKYYMGITIELVLQQSRTPELEKKKKYFMGIELVLPQSCTPALGSWIIERGIFMCIVSKYLLTAGLRERNINVTQLWPGILKFSRM